MKYFRFFKFGWLAIFVSGAAIIADSVARGHMSYILILNGFLAGMALSALFLSYVNERQAALIADMLALNQSLLDQNKQLVAEIMRANISAIRGDDPDGVRDSPPSANGRKPPSMY